MGKKELVDFFSAKKKIAGGDVDWERKKKQWLDDVAALYDKVQNEYLAGAVRKGDVSISRDEVDISEEFIGKYSIPKLIVSVGDERVEFLPKGCNVVGASGRVDLIGDMGGKTLVVQPGHRWGIVKTRTPALKIAPLDANSLLDALKEIMRP